jgi:prepilin signal peptidase PulO-like enzyme (type II secretory pathway)
MLIAFLVGLYGLFIGSFLNVVIYRVHSGKDFVKGRSQCPHCKHQLSALDLLPVVSWLALRGRCRYCKAPISIQYPSVELLTGAVFALLYASLHPQNAVGLLEFLLWLYIFSSFIVLSVYDVRWYLLPDKVLLPLMIPAVMLLLLYGFFTHSLQVIVGPVAAGLFFGGAFYALAVVSQGKWMGGGDIKLAFVMGLLLGLQKTTLAMFIAFNVAAVFGLALMAIKKLTRSRLIPFGPFLMISTLISLIYGSQLINWYLNISGINAL